jgi:hypothetical protein
MISHRKRKIKRRDTFFSNDALNAPDVPFQEGKILSATDPIVSQKFSTDSATDSASPAIFVALSRNDGSMCFSIFFVTCFTALSTTFSLSETAFCALIFFVVVHTAFFAVVLFWGVTVFFGVVVGFSDVVMRTKKIKLLFCSRTFDKIKKKEAYFCLNELT